MPPDDGPKGPAHAVARAEDQKHTRAIAIAAFFHAIGVMGTRPLVPLQANAIGIGPSEVGALVAVFAIVPLFTALWIGRLIDRLGVAWFLVAGSLAAMMGLALPALLPGRIGLYGSQAVVGTAFTVFALASQKAVGTLGGTAWDRERRVAVFSLGMALGAFVGPMIGGVIGDIRGIEYAFLALALGGALSAAASVWTPMERRTALQSPPEAPAASPLQVLGYHPYLGRAFLISALILLAKDVFVAFLPIYATELGLSIATIGLIIALFNGGGVASRLLLLPLLRRWGKNRVVLGSLLPTALLFPAVVLLGDGVALAAVALVIGLGLGLGQPLSISTTVALSPREKEGEVLGVRLGLNRLTQVTAPLCFGGLVLIAGVPGVFVATGVLLLAALPRLSIPDNLTS